MEVWLKPNRRVLGMAFVPALLLVAIGGLTLASYQHPAPRVLAALLVVLGLSLVVGLLRQFARPRIAYLAGNVLFYLRSGDPIAVPIHVVEAFFLGQSPTQIPGAVGKTEAINLVARLSQKSPEWAEQEVKAALGDWSDGYATIRGTWCEPLNGEVIRRLNRTLRLTSEANERASTKASRSTKASGA